MASDPALRVARPRQCRPRRSPPRAPRAERPLPTLPPLEPRERAATGSCGQQIRPRCSTLMCDEPRSTAATPSANSVRLRDPTGGSSTGAGCDRREGDEDGEAAAAERTRLCKRHLCSRASFRSRCRPARIAGAREAPPNTAPVGSRFLDYRCGRCGSCSPTTTASRPRACRRCAARCSSSPDIELAVIAPDGNRSATARSITTRRPLWVEEVDFDDGTVGYATDGTPVDCVRLADARADRGLRAPSHRLRHQPRLQPRRRHHLLGHGRRGARGHRARAARRSPSPSSRRRARWTSASATRSTSTAAAAFAARVVERARRRAAARRARCSTSTSRRASRRRRGRAAGQAHLPRRAQARRARSDGPPPLLDLRRRARLPRRGRAPTSPRSPPAASRSRRCTSTSPTARAWTRCARTTSRGCSRRRREEVE